MRANLSIGISYTLITNVAQLPSPAGSKSEKSVNLILEMS